MDTRSLLRVLPAAEILCLFVCILIFGFLNSYNQEPKDFTKRWQPAAVAAADDSGWWCDLRSWIGWECETETINPYTTLPPLQSDVAMPAAVPTDVAKPYTEAQPASPSVSSFSAPAIINQYITNPVVREIIREILVKDVTSDVTRFITRREYDAQVDAIMRSIEDSAGVGGSGISDITGESIEDLSDVTSMTKTSGDLLTWTGSAWSNIATSSLGITGSNAVDSVNAQTGVVVLDTGDISESGNLYFTTARARESLSSSATGISYATSTGVMSLTSGYTIPLSASTTEWSSFYDIPSTRVAAGDALTWSGNTLNFDGGDTPGGELGGTWASPTLDAEIIALEELSDVDTFTQAAGDILYWTGTGWNVTATSTWDTNTTYTAGDHLTLTGNDFDVDDDFVLNIGDTMTGNLVMGGTAANIALGSNYLSGDGDDEGLFVSSTGLLGVGTTTPSEALTVVGGISSVGEGIANEVYGLGATLISGPGNGNTLVGAYTEMAAAGFGQYNTIVGAYSSSSNAYNTIIGSRSSATGGTSVLIGESLSSSVTYSTVIGANSSVTGTGLIAMGYSAQSSHNNAVAIGWGVASAEDYEYVFGSRAVASTSPSIRLAGSTTQYNGQDLFELDTEWIDSTDATRKSRATLSVYDTAQRTFMQADATGSGVTTSFNGGSVGIGTTTPLSRLAIQTTGTTDILNLFETGGSEVLTVLESGFVGIGASTPAHMVHIKNNSSTYAGLDLEGGQAGDAQWVLFSGYPSAGDFSIRESGVQTSLTIKKTSGNVGIGTTTPSSKLHIDGTTAILSNFDNNTNSGADEAIAIQASMDGANTTNYILKGSVSGATTDYGIYVTGENYNYFSGNVGIGTTSPSEILTVGGGGQSGVQSGVSDGVYINPNSDGAQVAIETNSGVEGGMLALDNTNLVYMGAWSNHDLQIRSNNISYMTLTTAGDLGIGTTSPATKLHLYDGTADAAVLAMFQNDARRWSIGVNPSDNFRISDNTAVSDRLTIDTSGNVGIATSTPGRKLTVVGTVEFRSLTAAVGAGSLCLSSSNEVVYNSGSDNCLSSTRNTKHAITPLTLDAINILNTLEPVSFIYNGTDRVRYGFIAENTASVDDILATYNADGDLTGIDDRSILSVMVRAFQEFYREVMDRFTAQDSRIDALEERIRELEAREGIDAADSDEEENVDESTTEPDVEVVDEEVDDTGTEPEEEPEAQESDPVTDEAPSTEEPEVVEDTEVVADVENEEEVHEEPSDETLGL